jgi:hypothetical protein
MEQGVCRFARFYTMGKTLLEKYHYACPSPNSSYNDFLRYFFRMNFISNSAESNVLANFQFFYQFKGGNGCYKISPLMCEVKRENDG